MKLNTLVAALIATVAVPVFAQTATPNIDKREALQQQRIEQGVKSGQLTPREAARLDKGEAHIDKMEDKAKADGKVTAKERARIEHAQNVESKKIYREKHDRQHDFNHDGKKDRPHRGEKH